MSDSTGMNAAGKTGSRLEGEVKDILSRHFNTSGRRKFRLISNFRKDNSPFQSLISDNERKREYNNHVDLSTNKSVKIVPDHLIINIETGKCIILEDKNQDGGGNAYERLCKFTTPNMLRMLKESLDVKFNPVAFICSSRLVEPEFARKITAFLGDDFDYLFWEEGDENQLISFFENNIRQKLE